MHASYWKNSNTNCSMETYTFNVFVSMFSYVLLIKFIFLFAVTRGLEPPPHGLTVRHCNLFKPRHQILLAVHKGFEPLSRDRQSRISYLSTNGPNICHLNDYHCNYCTPARSRTETQLRTGFKSAA